MELGRRSFQGVLNILSFNRHFYVLGLSVLAMVIICHATIGFSDQLFWIIILSFLYGLIMPLIISAYVYDFSGYYNFTWLKNSGLDTTARSIVNINAGFDETSFIIKNNFPLRENLFNLNSNGCSWAVMTKVYAPPLNLRTKCKVDSF